MADGPLIAVDFANTLAPKIEQHWAIPRLEEQNRQALRLLQEAAGHEHRVMVLSYAGPDRKASMEQRWKGYFAEMGIRLHVLDFRTRQHAQAHGYEKGGKADYCAHHGLSTCWTTKRL